MSYDNIVKRWVAFNWEGKGRDTGGGQKRISYAGADIHSYRTCVARFVVNQDNVKAVLCTTRRYSVSSTRHVNTISAQVRWLTRQPHESSPLTGVQVFFVPSIGRRGAWSDDSTFDNGLAVSEQTHLDNSQHYVARFHAEIDDFIGHYRDPHDAVIGVGVCSYRAHDWRSKMHEDNIWSIANSHNSYREFFKADHLMPWLDAAHAINEARAERVAKLEKYLDPKAVARRERAKARALLRKIMAQDAQGRAAA